MKQYKNAIKNISTSYIKASDAKWELTNALYDNYDDICHDFAQAGVDFVHAIGNHYGETFNLTMVARCLKEAQYEVKDACAFLYSVEKALGITGACMALKYVGYVLPNKNGAGKKPETAEVAIVKAMKKLIAEKQPSAEERSAILLQMVILLK